MLALCERLLAPMPTPTPTHPSANPLTPERWREDKRGWEHRRWSNFNFVPYGTLLFLELKTRKIKQQTNKREQFNPVCDA